MTQMYSYNGAELPPLPEWDRETYPYAVILESGGSYALFYLSKPWSYGSPVGASGTVYTNRLYYYVDVGEVITRYGRSCTGDAGSWGTVFTNTKNNTTGTAPSVQHFDMSGYQLIWTNTDIPNTDDGTTYLAASEPVLVYNAADFFSGVACGLSGSGLPDFEETTCFGKGCLAGAQMRRSRPAGAL